MYMSIFIEDARQNASKIRRCNKLINRMIEDINNGNWGATSCYRNKLIKNISEIIKYWTGYTLVGEKKEPILKEAYQDFWSALLILIITGQKIDKHKLDDPYKILFNALYQGKVYRYLGYGNCDVDYNKKIVPVFDGCFVSGSKERGNSYILGKLYGTKTLLICNIKNGYYGIDIEKLGLSVGEEKEVMFPMVKECVGRWEYLEE